jgi:hypothetical protein
MGVSPRLPVSPAPACLPLHPHLPHLAPDPSQEVGHAITQLPEGFTPHRQIAKVYEARRNMVDSGEGVDWGMAEALAFGTLLAEGARGWSRAIAACLLRALGLGCRDLGLPFGGSGGQGGLKLPG